MIDYNNNNYTLEEMKSQMNLLKEKLEKQSIINEKMLLAAMTKKLDKISHSGRQIFTGGIGATLLATSIFFRHEFSFWFCATTFLMLLFCTVKTWQYHKDLWSMNISDVNLLEVGQKVSLLRKRYKDWYKIAIWMIVPWIAWLGIEAYMIHGEAAIPFIAGALVGGILGAILGTRINNNIIHMSDELLNQIKEYQQELKQ